MSQHVSLRVDSVGKKHRNVLKRLERVKKLQSEDKWKDRGSVFGLPKVKSIKVKVRKSSGGTPKEGESAGTGAVTGTAAGAGPKTTTAGAKTAGAGSKAATTATKTAAASPNK
jgi:small basic protein (TIGR04137 family)